MGLSITNENMSPTRRRIDFNLKQSGIFSPTINYKMRIVAGNEMPEDYDEFLEGISQVIKKKEDWLEGKKSRYYRFADWNATVFILSEETEGDKTEEE